MILKIAPLVKALNVIKYLAIYYLSIKMICFAIPKFLFMQFRVFHYESFIPLAEISKLQHMWSFFGRSYNYNLFIGTVEFLIGILVVFNRTRLIALLLSLGVCANILILNIEFDVYFAIQHVSLDLAITVLLLTEYYKDLYKFFIELGGKFRVQVNSASSAFLKKLPFLYIIIFPIGYFIFAYKLRSSVNEELVGSYRIKDFQINDDYLEIKQGKLGKTPMIFFERKNLAVLSINDSIYFGGYSTKNDSITIYFRTPIVKNIRKIKGELKNQSLLRGAINDSALINMEIERLLPKEDYLNNLYTQ